MNQRILFNYASRSRPLNFFRGLDSIVNNLHDKENYHVQCTFDTDDLSMNNEGVILKLNTYKNLSFYFGISESKIHAINRECDKFPNCDIIVNMSDDFVFTALFFDRVIRMAFTEIFPDTDGFAHFHDGVQPRLATMSIIGRKYFQRTGSVIYPPEYISVFCDNHSQRVAQLLGKYYYMGDHVRIMKHLHPIHDKSIPYDEQYRRTEDRAVYAKDQQTYLNFEKNNFGL